MSETRDWGNAVAETWREQHEGPYLIVGKGGLQDDWGDILDPDEGRDYPIRLEDLEVGEQYNFVLCAWVFSYFDDPILALSRAKDALVSGGHLGIITRRQGWDPDVGVSRIEKWAPTERLLIFGLHKTLGMEFVEYKSDNRPGTPLGAVLMRKP